MSNDTEVTVKFLTYTRKFTGDHIETMTPGGTTIEVLAEKEGYNPASVEYAVYPDGTRIFDHNETLTLTPYQPVTLTVNSSTPGTTLTFYCDTGTISENTITVAKGTKVRYTLSKTGYSTLDRTIYVNENTVENESLDEAVFKYTVNTSSTKTIIVPFTTVTANLNLWDSENASLTINWGDGTSTTIGRTFTEAEITHTYTGNSYQISITSTKNTMPAFYAYRNATQATLITSIDTPLLKMCATEATYVFYRCGNLTTVPENVFKYNSQLTSLAYAFYYMSAVNNNTFTIPEKLFYYNTELENLNYAFGQYYSNRNKITSIPEHLFDYSPKINTISYIFYYCGITSIPENLFKNLRLLTNTSYAFMYCTPITSIPENLFKYNINLINANYVFAYDNQNTVIPENLFRYNPHLRYCAGAFRNHRLVNTFPTNIFKYNTELENVSYTFHNCIKFTTIPTDFFENNPKLTNVLGVFQSCPISNLSPIEFLNILPSTVTSIGYFNSWTKTTNEYFTPEYVQAFWNKCHILNYICSGWRITTIPEHIFDEYTENTSFQYAFQSCTNLTSIPADLFKYNTAVTSFYYTFGSCSALTSVPADLFRYNTNVTNFGYTFYYCSTLTTVPADLFRYNLKVTSFYETFYYCNKLTMRSDLFGSDLTNRFKQQASLDFGYFFYVYNWSGTRGTAPALWNCTFTDSDGATITPYKSYCFYGHSSSSLSNYSSIPSAWRSSS